MTSVVSLSSYDYAVGPWALRLTGQASSLSTLAERAILRRLRFHLRLWEEAGEEVNALATASTATVRGPLPTPAHPRFELSGQGDELVNLTQLVQIYVQQYLEHQDLTLPQGLSQGPMTLAPVGLTRHRLTVAPRAGTERGRATAATVTLSMLQLADLATVLAQAEQAVEVLPAAMMATQRRRPRLPLWAGSIAAVLVAAVLGSQWLGQAPPAVVLSPRPTAEREASPEDWAAGENNQAGFSAESPPLETGETEGPRPESPSGDTPLPTEANPGASGSPGIGPPPNPASTAPPPVSAPPPVAAAPRAPREANPQSSPAATAPPPSPQPPPNGGSAPEIAGSRTPAPPSPDHPPTRLAPLTDSAPAAAPLETERPAPIHAATLEAGEEGLEARAMADALGILRTALESTWQPIPGLTSPLRYRLTLGPTGTILAVEPLTAPARTYLNQGPLLQVGEVLPHVRLSSPLTVEVDLLPSGEVQVSPNGQP